MKRILICVMSCVMTGCSLFTTRVPVVREAPKCVVPPGLLAGCAKPAEIAQGLTFEDMADVLRRDRFSLQQCTTRFDDLVDAIAGCNTVLDTYNATVRAINDATKK